MDVCPPIRWSWPWTLPQLLPSQPADRLLYVRGKALPCAQLQAKSLAICGVQVKRPNALLSIHQETIAWYCKAWTAACLQRPTPLSLSEIAPLPTRGLMRPFLVRKTLRGLKLALPRFQVILILGAQLPASTTQILPTQLPIQHQAPLIPSP